MSYQNGLSALHLEMPDKIPRTEYSAEFHWELIQKVTGIPVSSHSLPAVQSQASREFVRAWDYGFYWHTIPACRQLGDMRTNMGHARSRLFRRNRPKAFRGIYEALYCLESAVF